MSQETREWLNSMTLIGFTDVRGKAWHYKAALQGKEPNHYPQAIPVADVERRLFDWTAESEPVFVLRDGVYVPVAGRQAVSASDNGDVLGIFTTSYQRHQYREWLLTNVGRILDDGRLGIGSAGQLKNRGQAWVSVEVPENIETPEGVAFRPNLIAATSFDGSLATTYKRTATVVVCDNTLAAGLRSDGGVFRLKHSSRSLDSIADAREALDIVYSTADDFSAEVAKLCSVEVSDKIWRQVLDRVVPVAKDKGRSRTLSLKKQDELFALYRNDDRVAPWAGTAFGVLQAFNTYNHHVRTIKSASRTQRNNEAAITGSFAVEDAKVLEALEQVLVAA